MKMKMIMIGVLGLFATVAMAGLSQPAIVTIDTDLRLAQGDMGTARYSDNDVEVIGCGIRRFDDGINPPFTFGFCQATDAAGLRVMCSTFSDSLLSAMAAGNDYSFVTFSWNEADECTRIGYSTQSFYLPTKKEAK